MPDRHHLDKTWVADKVVRGTLYPRATYAQCTCGFTASYLTDDGSAQCDVVMHAARRNQG